MLTHVKNFPLRLVSVRTKVSGVVMLFPAARAVSPPPTSTRTPESPTIKSFLNRRLLRIGRGSPRRTFAEGTRARRGHARVRESGISGVRAAPVDRERSPHSRAVVLGELRERELRGGF